MLALTGIVLALVLSGYVFHDQFLDVVVRVVEYFAKGMDLS